jgi:hypothetical protein
VVGGGYTDPTAAGKAISGAFASNTAMDGVKVFSTSTTVVGYDNGSNGSNGSNPPGSVSGPNLPLILGLTIPLTILLIVIIVIIARRRR